MGLSGGNERPSAGERGSAVRERDADRGRPGLAVLSWAVPVQVPVSDTDADGEVGKAPSPPH